MIKLYTTHCPRCSVLEKKLKAKNIEYIECTDTTEMTQLGIDAVPVLQVNNDLLNFQQANAWVNEQEG